MTDEKLELREGRSPADDATRAAAGFEADGAAATNDLPSCEKAMDQA